MKQTILEAIKSHGPIKRVDLLRRVNATMEVVFIADRTLRQAISDLIADGEPIASSEKGYSIIQSVDQLRKAVNYLKAKSRSIAIRGNTLIGNYDRCYQDCPVNIQFKLF